MTEARSYADVKGVSREEFERRKIKFNDGEATVTPPADIEAMEDLLSLSRGTLKDQKFLVNKQACRNCGRTPTFLDIVKTAVDKNVHSTSLMAQTLVGTKYILNPPRTADCANCATPLTLTCDYDNDKYGCCWNVGNGG